MEPRSNHGQPNWLATWLQDRGHQVLASRRLCSDVTYGERKETRSEATVRHWSAR
jgi:hypothetical protein